MARRPRSAIFYRRSPTPACGLGPRPRHGRVPRRFPRDAFLLLHALGQSPHSARPHSFVFRSGDRRTAQSTPTAGPLPWPAFIRFAVRASTSGCLGCSSSIECRCPASNATGTPIVGTSSTAPSPVPISCSSHIVPTGSSAELTDSEGTRERTLDLAKPCRRERTLDLPRPPRPYPWLAMRIR